MAETCPRCGRPERSAPYESADECQGTQTRVCADVAAAYRRGIDRGVELAKEHARPRIQYLRPSGEFPCIDWTNVYKAAKAAKGEA